MPYRVVNRHTGFIILPNGEKLAKYNSTKVEDITPELKRMELKGLISIHYLIEPSTNQRKKDLAGWEALLESDLGKSQLPTPLHEGMLLYGRGEKYIYEDGMWKHKGFSPGRVVIIEIDGVQKLTIDITGIDIVKFGQDIFDLSPSTGKAKLIAKTIKVLPPEEVMKHVYPTGEIFLKMDIVKGRDCRMVVYRREENLLIEPIWPNHSEKDFIELLRRHGIA